MLGPGGFPSSHQRARVILISHPNGPSGTRPPHQFMRQKEAAVFVGTNVGRNGE